MNRDSFGNSYYPSWYTAGGFPPGTFAVRDTHLLPCTWSDEVLDRAAKLRDERDVVA